MADYTFKSPDGKQVTLRGDNPPTEEVIREALSRVGEQSVSPARFDKSIAQEDARNAPKTAVQQEQLAMREKAGLKSNKPQRDPSGLLADIALEGGGATGGQLIGAIPALSVPTAGLSVPIGGAIGGGTGNVLAQRRRMAAGEQEDFKWGQLLSAIGTGAIPAGPTGTGAKLLAREAGKQALGGLAGKVVETAIDEGRIPTPGESLVSTILPAVGGAVSQKLGTNGTDPLNPTKRATLEAGRKEGLVVVPSSISDSEINKRLEGLVGVPRIKQAASLKNQPAVTASVKRDLGVRQSDDITEELLAGIRKQEAAPYAEIESMASKASKEIADIERATLGQSTHETEALRAVPVVKDRLDSLKIQAAADINALRDARLAAKEGYSQYGRTADRKALDAARASEELASTLEDRIELAAKEFGTNDLLGRLKASRQRIAKTWDVENALNTGDAEISAEILARLGNKGRPLSGNLEAIADFTNAFPQVMRPGSKVPPLSGTATETGYALASLATGHPLLAASMLARGPTRSLLLSKPYQALLTSRPFDMPNAAMATRLLSQAAAAEVTRDGEDKSKRKSP